MTEAVMGKPTEHAHGPPAGGRWLGRHEAYMGGCDAPSLGKADPSVAHAADPLGITLQVLDIGGREVPTKCCNDEMTLAPVQVSRLARRAEGSNGIMSIQVFAFISGDDEAIVQCCIVAGQRKTDPSVSVRRSGNESADSVERR